MSAAKNLQLFTRHDRNWEHNLYVYPVISRRSKGLSIGINLNPDKACNFDCIYCQVDRRAPARVRTVDLSLLHDELKHMLTAAVDQSLYGHERLGEVPTELRRLNDVAFSGDGEPTTCPQFPQSVALVAELLRAHSLDSTKIVLITDACYLTKPSVIRGLEVMDHNRGEIWAKLDAGTEDYHRLITRPNFSLAHVVDNITAAATVRPVVIQSLFMQVHGAPPAAAEIEAYCDRLRQVLDAGGAIKLVQVYTVARPPAESFVSPLTECQLQDIARIVIQRTALTVETYE